MIDNNSNAQAAIDQSIRIPDYFSCQNCAGGNRTMVHRPDHRYADRHGNVEVCQVLREENTCAKQMLSMAIQSGAVQIVLHLPAEVRG